MGKDVSSREPPGGTAPGLVDSAANTLPARVEPAPDVSFEFEPGTRFGRYEIVGRLGAGAMGVVFEAQDTELDRTVALKVVRPRGGDEEPAQSRLRREAQTMARLSHSNVATVFDIGTVGERLFIAMEIVRGGTLRDRICQRRPWRDELCALIDAGRGLAAAHEAGVIHRDFKPDNVLVRTDGTVCVADFGLAREAAESRNAALTTASPPTQTTGVAGTPAYMAPEGFEGIADAATDQFAFAVTAFELLEGRRPFERSSPSDAYLQDIRKVRRRPWRRRELPARVRTVIDRGLALDPAARWPSMHSLCDALAARRSRPLVWVLVLILMGGAGLAAVAFHALGRTAAVPPPVACPTPSLDPDAVWSDAKHQELARRRSTEARLLNKDFVAWQTVRVRTCGSAAAAHGPRHACLDAILVRFDVIARAVEGLAPSVPTVDPRAFAIDPAVCEAARPPRLAPAATPALRVVVATAMRAAVLEAPYPRGAAAELLQRVAADPCAAATARLLLARATPLTTERDYQLAEAEQDTERCSDDRVRAEIAIAVARYALTTSKLDTAISAKVKSADVAVYRVAQRDLTADVDALRLETANRADHLDEAIAFGEAAVAGYAARERTAAMITIGLELLELRDLRASADDATAVPRLYDEWRALAMRELGEGHPIVRKIEAEHAKRMFVHGDVEGGHARLAKLWRPIPGERARRIRGRVVDRRGVPVESATVTVGRILMGNAISAAAPFSRIAAEQRVATTGKAGEFEIPDAPPEGLAIAQLGEARSKPLALADNLTLALEPTSRIEGRIDLRGEPASRVIVSVQDQRLPISIPYQIFAPVGPDGSFSIEGVPRAQVRVFAVLRNPRTRSYASTTLDVRGPVARGVSIAVARSKRVVHVIVRSTVAVPVVNAEVYVFPGHRASTTALEMFRELRTANEHFARQIDGEHAPPPVVAQARAGDMFATMHEVPEGAATACAIGLPADLSDRDLDSKINANLARIEVRCASIPADAEVVVVEVPPWPRLTSLTSKRHYRSR